MAGPDSLDYAFGLANLQASVTNLNANLVSARAGNGLIYTGYCPPLVTPIVGQPVCLMRQDTVIMTDSWISGNASSVTITSMSNGNGGVMPDVHLVSDNAGSIKLGQGIALPPDRYLMTLEGPFEVYDKDPAKSLTIKQYKFEFDVFANGFSNIPVRVAGGLPKNGRTSTAFQIEGAVPPNNGAGPTTMGIEPFGQPEVTYTVQKALGAQGFIWNVTTPITIPTEGITAIRFQMNF